MSGEGLSFQSLELTYIRRANIQALTALRKQEMRHHPSGSFGFLKPVGPRARDASTADVEWQTVRHHVWWRRGDGSWRDDVSWSNGTSGVSIVRQDDATVFVSVLASMFTNRLPALGTSSVESLPPEPVSLPTLEDRLEMHAFLRPGFLSESWKLGEGKDGTFLEREVVLVEASWVGEARCPFWTSVGEYEFRIDLERSIPLRIAGLHEGVEVGVIEAEAIAFDGPIPDSVFDFDPPEGTKVWRPVT